MLYRLHKPAVVLAALLQVLPLVRNIITSPAAGSTFAIILRWGIGAGAVVGSVDAVSGATSLFTSPTAFSGAVGTYFTNNVSATIGGGNTASSSDYFRNSGFPEIGQRASHDGGHAARSVLQTILGERHADHEWRHLWNADSAG